MAEKDVAVERTPDSSGCTISHERRFAGNNAGKNDCKNDGKNGREKRRMGNGPLKQAIIFHRRCRSFPVRP
jgi:hypothetical protein